MKVRWGMMMIPECVPMAYLYGHPNVAETSASVVRKSCICSLKYNQSSMAALFMIMHNMMRTHRECIIWCARMDNWIKIELMLQAFELDKYTDFVQFVWINSNARRFRRKSSKTINTFEANKNVTSYYILAPIILPIRQDYFSFTQSRDSK